MTERVRYHHLIGADQVESAQFGIVGQVIPDIDDKRAAKVAIDLDNPQCITVFGAPGGGKSYLLGVLLEMMAIPIANLNRLAQPMTTVIFHFAEGEDYAPEFTSMTQPNTRVSEVEPLRANYQAEPQGLPNQFILCPKALVEQRQREYPHIPVHALTFHPSELGPAHWRVLMGAVGSRSSYLNTMNRIMANHRRGITPEVMRSEVQASKLSDSDKDRALEAVLQVEQYMDSNSRLEDLIKPGRNIIVDLRDELMHPDDAFALLQVVLQIVAGARHNGKKFPKAVCFDEAHNYMGNPDLVGSLVKINRLMRHRRTSLIIASQDPMSVPQSIIEMSTMTFLSKMFAKRWLSYIQEVNTAFDNLTPRMLADLGRGQGYFWALKSDEYEYTRRATKIQVRTRVTQHGGATVLASEDSAATAAGGPSAPSSSPVTPSPAH